MKIEEIMDFMLAGLTVKERRRERARWRRAAHETLFDFSLTTSKLPVPPRQPRKATITTTLNGKTVKFTFDPTVTTKRYIPLWFSVDEKELMALLTRLSASRVTDQL